MKLRIDGCTVEAKLDSHYADTPYGHAMLVLHGDLLIEPSFASLRDYKIVKATPAERAALKAAGYDLPDYVSDD